jgi:hypothetical protein
MQEESEKPAARADPALYPKMRLGALRRELPETANGKVLVVLMDWHVPNGTFTVLAAWDGTASLYLSSGGGFIGGSERFPEIREAALMAITVAAGSPTHFLATEEFDLPARGDIRFFIRTKDGVKSATVAEARLRDGSHPLVVLSSAMQQIVTAYRMRFPTHLWGKPGIRIQ